jgi:hypothetical protein
VRFAFFRVKESILRMKRVHKALAFVSLAMLALIVSCGHPRTLQSIEIIPHSAGIIGSDSIGAQTQYRAFGHFINPAETVDITDQVDWSTSDVGFDTVVNGLVTHITATCGSDLIIATAHKGVVGPGTTDVVVTGTATYTVTDPSVPGCPTSIPAQ